ncbi:CaiB/BaiF CoA transferase family protein [Gemmobacter sp.]|uniref:CaiB/BaiF CoA transferase family protein n=1 Tax=Gemmobacter sp. TaxID=1898957 RepID=UPI002AFFF8BA|nr:CoA transferase [Gemmobacter sp.]
MSSMKSCRVLDLGIITAGAGTSAVLSDLGAEVIKIESPTYRDPFRVWPGVPQKEPTANPISPFFRATNRGKKNIGLNLKDPRGRAIFLQLVDKADIVVENFRRGVLDRLGLGFETLKQVNPDIILASVSSQGEFGPDRDYVSFGSTLEAVGGLADSTGYRGGPPIITGRELNFPDQIAVVYAAGAILTAWQGRRAGRGAVHLDLSQRELTSFLCGEMFAGDRPARDGNADARYPGQGCYLCRDGMWIALSPLPGEAARLCGDGSAPLTDRLGRWAAGHDSAAALAMARAAGIAAAPVSDGLDLLRLGDEWRGAVITAPDGMILKGMPFTCREEAFTVSTEAAEFGADTAEVLSSLAGLGQDALDTLAAEGVIALPARETAEG